MNVASLDLCRELYELSGWQPVPSVDYGFYWMSIDRHGKPCDWHIERMFGPQDRTGEVQVPAYDLGYLLRNLPLQIGEDYDSRVLRMDAWTEHWQFAYWIYEIPYEIGEADTPEDATCKLAIALINQGILTRDPKS
jgi:hypothetical protein